MSDSQETHGWISSAAARLTPGRVRAHAVILAVCLWGVCAADYATPGVFDRAGNIKFQDFVQFPVSARLIAEGRANELYDDQVLANGIRVIVGRETTVFLRYFYGPQVALAFVPLIGLPFLAQAGIWVALSSGVYFACIFLLFRICTNLSADRGTVAVCALAYPPLFHFFMRGQLSAVPLLIFTAAYFAFRERHDLMAGVVLGFLMIKPQFLVAIPVILLFARAWKSLTGVIVSAAAQLALTWRYFGSDVMHLYFRMLLHSASAPQTTELSYSAIQMHSLHSFWELLIPWPRGVWLLYVVSSLAVIGIATAIWRSSSLLSIRFSALLFAAVLVNPHIYIYDLLSLAPALLLLADWTLTNEHCTPTPLLRLLLYLAFIVPLFGPVSRWTHLQLSVPIFATILWLLYRLGTPGHKLAIAEPAVV